MEEIWKESDSWLQNLQNNNNHKRNDYGVKVAETELEGGGWYKLIVKNILICILQPYTQLLLKEKIIYKINMQVWKT